MPSSPYKLGIDVGSTTVKLAVLDEKNRIVHSCYRRHNTDVRATVRELFAEGLEEFGDVPMSIAITGSGGLLLSTWLDLEFVQEVISSKTAVETFIPQTDVVIELGGEDAKIIYFDHGIEQRMNGTCAGGTGAFIDQMASLLNTDAGGLNEMAKDASIIHPIASRCGVFAKTDVQPLLNEGARREDIAASIFQSVVTQTISGLACGRPIRGYVTFLGGPLNYLSELRKRFEITLELDDEHAIVPENAHLFVAAGAALAAEVDEGERFSDLLARLDALGDTQGSEVERLDPLFATPEDYEEFVARHEQQVVPKGDITDYRGRVYIGIDAGSTTMKAALVGEDGQLFHTVYGKNRGDVLGSARKVLEEFYSVIPEGCELGHATVTGYGEGLLLAGLRADSGEIETVAHLRGARAVLPEVEFILDVGGQDMKCLRIHDGVIDHIMLNEACSSGCGSFLEAFADSMGMTVQEFAEVALTAKAPVDLGSRCTVFMNSRVKQAQKEGATVGDISSGLSYSVMKNALFKVIKIRDAEEIGEHVIVQGGTFLNDSVLRAFEMLTGKHVYRPDIAGNMGAYGAALLARDRDDREKRSTLLTMEELEALEVKHKNARCQRCSNHCLLTITTFGEGRRFVTGNRCEKGAGKQREEGAQEAPNLYKYKERRLFDYEPLPAETAPRGTVGIPRALNMYENYPFWFTFFNELGFSVMLSDPSTKATYEAGIESMPSESVCYPAKLSHGHIMDLLKKDPDFIWMPSIRWERGEDPTAGNTYNCPIVMSYSEALRLNVDELHDSNVLFMNPFLPYHDKKELKRRLYDVMVDERTTAVAEGRGRMSGERITKAEISRAVDAAWEEDELFKEEMRAAGERTLAWIEQNDGHGIVLAGRPYHNDPEINHAIPELVEGFGFAALTEDSVSHLMPPERPIRVVDQWMYHSRLYAAARYVTTRNDLDLIQLNSFGCGLDALTTDQVQEILEASGKVYTALKIDEISNLGAARIRIRSLMAALKDQRERLEREVGVGEKDAPVSVPVERESKSAAFPKVSFTKDMKEEGYTILAPQMAPIHFDLIAPIFRNHGYNLVVLPSDDPKAVEAGLKYVNNDICYPSILVTGQIMEAALSGEYDMDRTAVIITQTGGGCRATNYIALIRKALKDAGIPHVPVISLAAVSLGEDNPGFKVSMPMLKDAIHGVIMGDVLMKCLYRVRPYEAEPGSAQALYDKHMELFKEGLADMNRKRYTKLVTDCIRDFDTLPLVGDGTKPRVGVVGEILVKFHPTANNQVVEVIENEGCEAVVPGLTDFFLFGLSGATNQKDELGSSLKKRLATRAAIKYIEYMRKPAHDAFEASERFDGYTGIFELADMAEDIISLCNTMGEGWLLTAEMVELIHAGAPNIICTQPFACLPNHVVGKAVIKELRRRFPESNIVAVDYDPGASEVNQLNRIKLMIAVAKANFEAGNPDTFELSEVERLEEAETRILRERSEREAAEEAAGIFIEPEGCGCGPSCSSCGGVSICDDTIVSYQTPDPQAGSSDEQRDRDAETYQEVTR